MRHGAECATGRECGRAAGDRSGTAGAGAPRALLAVALGATFVGGCPAALEQAVNAVLSPAASSNVLTLPYSGLLPLVRLLAQWW